MVAKSVLEMVPRMILVELLIIDNGHGNKMFFLKVMLRLPTNSMLWRSFV